MKIGLINLTKDFWYDFNFTNKDVDYIELKTDEDIEQADGLMILAKEKVIFDEKITELVLWNNLMKKVNKGLPLWIMGGGIYLVAKRGKTYPFGLMDISVSEEVFPKSFKGKVYIQALGHEEIQGVFYKLPWIEKVAPHVGVMAEYKSKIVMARQGNILASVFFPIEGENKLFYYFLDMIKRTKECY